MQRCPLQCPLARLAIAPVTKTARPSGLTVSDEGLPSNTRPTHCRVPLAAS